MAYRITKDCDTGWDELFASSAPHSWGASDGQASIARNIAAGDILLHFIDRTRCWAGYSIVSGPMQENTAGSIAYRTALPQVIPLERGLWLTMEQCPHTREIAGLSPIKFFRQRTFTIVSDADGKLIQAAIDAAKAKSPVIDEAFRKKWDSGADGYYWNIARLTSGGRCWLCNETVETWLKRNLASITLSVDEIKSIGSFVDIAHIKDRAKGGPIEPDNVRALCPTCHRIIDRLSPERKAELLAERSEADVIPEGTN